MSRKRRKGIDRNPVFGTDAERYISRLFLLMQNPNGTRRPDLISGNGIYNPLLSIEVKSGYEKGILTLNQLHYALTSSQDYLEVFGEELPERETDGFLEGVDWREYLPPLLGGGGAAYYYNLVTRKNNIHNKDLDKPWSAIKLVWGNQFIFPHPLAYAVFVSERARRSEVNLKECERDVLEKVQRNILDENSAQEHSKEDYQNVYFSDLRAIFEGNEGLTTELGKTRLDYVRQIYPGVDDLKKLQFQGPNGSIIYALVSKEDYNLFNNQIRKVLDRRVPVLDSVFRRRARAVRLLDRIAFKSSDYSNGGGVPSHLLEGGLHPLEKRQRGRLEHFVNWINPDGKDKELVLDEGVDLSDGDVEMGEDDIPF